MKTIKAALTITMVLSSVLFFNQKSFASETISVDNSLIELSLSDFIATSNSDEIRLQRRHSIYVDTSLGYPLLVGVSVAPKLGYLYQLNSHWALGGSVGGVSFLLTERDVPPGVTVDLFGRYYGSSDNFSWFVDLGARGYMGGAPGAGAFLRPGVEYRASNGWNSGAYINLSTTVPSALEAGLYTGFSF